jgi:acetyl esterase
MSVQPDPGAQLPAFLQRDEGPVWGDQALRSGAALLEKLGLLPIFHRQTPAAARAKMWPWRGPIGRAVHGPNANVPVEDLSLDGPGGPLPIRRYIGGENGLLLWFHGGGYVAGDLRSHDRVCRQIAQQGGVVVVAVEYRLAPEHPHPAALEDAVCALKACAARAAAWGTPGPLRVGGDSAGANLTVALLQRCREVDVAEMILAYPAADTARDGASVREFGAGPLLHQADVAWFEAQSAPQGGLALVGFDLLGADAAGRPGGSLAGLPPATLLLCGRDLLRDEGIALGQRLRERGGAARGWLYPEAVHGVLQTFGISGAGARMIGRIASIASGGRAGPR